jgi:uncharacterized damage-inducible protein DinB
MRSELDLLREWYAYNSFVRKKYHHILCKLPKRVLTRERGASFPSLLDIFTHVLDAYRWWFLYVYSDKLHEYRRLREAKLSLEEIRDEERKIDLYVRKFLSRLSLTDLERSILWHDITRTGKRSKKVRKCMLRDMLWHLIEEELQHRGELNALLWQINVNPPVTGWSPWEEDSEANAFWAKWRDVKSDKAD